MLWFPTLTSTNFCPMSIKTLTEQILGKISTTNKWQTKFIIHFFELWFKVRGRHNYVNIARYGHLGEDTYRNNSGKYFDFLKFNIQLAKDTLSEDRVITFDPFFVSKSGKHTPGTGYFWSGCAGKETFGLEFSGIGTVDLKDKSALHLLANQTIKTNKDQTLLQFYAQQLIDNKDRFFEISKVVVADAYFSKSPFVEAITAVGFTLVSRLRKDAVMRYFYLGPQKKGRGRKKKYDGKIDPKNLREDQFSVCARCKEGKWIAYEAVVNIPSWKKKVKLVVEHTLDSRGNIKSYKLYVCTDTEMKGERVKRIYNYRFQSEFLFRDAKQHSGLNHCQARSVEKLHFHINTSLTMVSLAKAAYHLSKPQKERRAFSLASIRNEYANTFFFDRIISMFNVCADSDKIKLIREDIKRWGKIAA